MTIKDKKKYEEVDARLEQLLEKGTELVAWTCSARKSRKR